LLKPNDRILQKIRKVADYQFGKGSGNILFSKNIKVSFSKKTGKIRYIYDHEKLFATIRPETGLFSLTIKAATRLFKRSKAKRLWVKVERDASLFIEKENDAFAKHVIDVDENIRPMEEVIILNELNEVIAVGKSLLSGIEMKTYNKGVAVKIRKGRKSKVKERSLK
jgi:predicted RNA-binding protein (TIGR00451 family)